MRPQGRIFLSNELPVWQVEDDLLIQRMNMHIQAGLNNGNSAIIQNIQTI